MNTKLLRQKILDLAIRGKLTEQKKSDGTTKDLLASIAASSACHSERSAKGAKSKNLAKEIIPLNKDEAPFEIPENWEWVKLGDIYSVGSAKRVLQEDWKDSGIPFYRAREIAQLANGEKVKDDLFITQELYESLKTQYGVPQSGDILVSAVGTIGKTYIVKESDCFYYKDASVICLKKKSQQVSSKYLKIVLASDFLQKQMYANSSGTTVDTITISVAQEYKIPLPPLAEQKRIVAAIESAFAEITAIENNQELLKKHIKQGRQKILDLAIRGKLTEQKESDGTTADLLASIAANVIASEAKQSKKNKNTEPKEIIPLDKNEAPFEIPENWEWVRLGDLSEKIQYGYNAPAKDTGRIKMVRITDIHDNAVEWDSVPFCDIEESEIPTYLLKKNDILFARTGGTVGKSFIVNEVPEDAVYAGYLIRTRYGKNINAQYMKYFMESNLYWVQLREGCIATAQPNCNGQTLGKMRIPLPPLAEQQRIVAAIESAFTEFDAMECN